MLPHPGPPQIWTFATTHPALRLTDYLQAGRSGDSGGDRGLSLEQLIKGEGIQRGLPGTTAEPLVPHPRHLIAERVEANRVIGHAKMPEVPVQRLSQQLPLPPDRPVPVGPAPLIDPL